MNKQLVIGATILLVFADFGNSKLSYSFLFIFIKITAKQ